LQRSAGDVQRSSLHRRVDRVPPMHHTNAPVGQGGCSTCGTYSPRTVLIRAVQAVQAKRARSPCAARARTRTGAPRRADARSADRRELEQPQQRIRQRVQQLRPPGIRGLLRLAYRAAGCAGDVPVT
jgi:hypothetical protein